MMHTPLNSQIPTPIRRPAAPSHRWKLGVGGCPRWLGLALAVTAVIIITPAVDAQRATRERTLFVSAVDDKGEPVTGLGPEAFVVREDGARREILRVSPATEPIDIALMIDNSQAAQDEVTFIREGVSSFLAKMTAGNKIAMIGLAERPTILVDYTDDVKRLNDGVGRIFAQPSSGMTLLDALFESAQGLRKRETPRAAIVAVVTDGTEFTNRYSKDVTRALTEAGVALHIVGMGRFVHNEEHSIRERSFLIDEGPRATGGQRVTLLAPMALNQAMQKLARELSSQYKVVYGRPESLVPPEKIEVTSGRQGLTVRGTPARGEGRS
jgi:VWFA-related protein